MKAAEVPTVIVEPLPERRCLRLESEALYGERGQGPADLLIGPRQDEVPDLHEVFRPAGDYAVLPDRVRRFLGIEIAARLVPGRRHTRRY